MIPSGVNSSPLLYSYTNRALENYPCVEGLFNAFIVELREHILDNIEEENGIIMNLRFEIIMCLPIRFC